MYCFSKSQYGAESVIAVEQFLYKEQLISGAFPKLRSIAIALDVALSKNPANVLVGSA
jgi:hypothetical protein